MPRLFTAVLALIALTAGVVNKAAFGAEDVCSRFGRGAVVGRVQNSRLTEISGLVASRQHPGVFWTHNDSSGKPELFALSATGADLGAYAFSGATAIDWEDLALGPKRGAAGSFLYAGDIGNNSAAFGSGRAQVTVWRVAEPTVLPKAPGGKLSGVERIDLVYPDGPEDAEAMVVDPVRGDLVIVTKSLLGNSRILVAPAASLVAGARVTMKDMGTIQIIPPVVASTFPGTFVTGASISTDGSLILLRTYHEVLAFDRAMGESVVDALLAGSCDAQQMEEGQGEAVAIAADGSRYVTISEGTNQPVHSFAISGASSAAPIETTPTTSTSLVRRILARTGDDATTVLVGVVAIVAVALIARARLRD